MLVGTRLLQSSSILKPLSNDFRGLIRLGDFNAYASENDRFKCRTEFDCELLVLVAVIGFPELACDDDDGVGGGGTCRRISVATLAGCEVVGNGGGVFCFVFDRRGNNVGGDDGCDGTLLTG